MYEERVERISASAKRLALLLLPVVIVIFAVGSHDFVYGEKKAEPEIEIKKISNLGTGERRIDIPSKGGWRYMIGSAKERIFKVKIKNNTKKAKRDVTVKLFAYDKKGELIGEKEPRRLRDVYADRGYLDRILQPRKKVDLYFTVHKEAKYIKVELFCEDELMDVKTYPSSFPERLK